MAEQKKKKKELNPFEELMRKLKIQYAIGKDPITSVMASRGFSPAKNAALNLGALMRVPYDPEMRIRPKDPQQQLRANNMRIGETERLTNTYSQPRMKMAN